MRDFVGGSGEDIVVEFVPVGIISFLIIYQNKKSNIDVSWINH